MTHDGAGRPRGSHNKRQQALVDALEISERSTPLSYMLRVMNDPSAPVERRDKMALAAAPFLHSKLTPTAWLPTREAYEIGDDENRDDAFEMVQRLIGSNSHG
jgi:hypothetical protein